MIGIFLAEGFEEVEAIAPIDVLRRCGLEAVTVGVTGKTVTGAHAIPVECDCTLEEAVHCELDAVVLPGGMPGTRHLQENERVLGLIRACYDRGRLVAAICAAPSILGGLGLLEGKEAVCFPGFEQALKGARLSSAAVCQDGGIITAKGAGAALEFGEKIAAHFIGEEKARQVLDGMQYIR